VARLNWSGGNVDIRAGQSLNEPAGLEKSMHRTSARKTTIIAKWHTDPF
jgi:hypothetical protein